MGDHERGDATLGERIAPHRAECRGRGDDDGKFSARRDGKRGVRLSHADRLGEQRTSVRGDERFESCSGRPLVRAQQDVTERIGYRDAAAEQCTRDGAADGGY